MADDREMWEQVKADHHAGVPAKEICVRHGIKPVEFIRRASVEGWLKRPSASSADVPVVPLQSAAGASAQSARAWEDAIAMYRTGFGVVDIVSATRLDRAALLERIATENWRPDLGHMLAERCSHQLDGDEALRRVDAALQGNSPTVTSVHRCGECGEVVKRPVYCGTGCRQKAYRGRKRGRNKKPADGVASTDG